MLLTPKVAGTKECRNLPAIEDPTLGPVSPKCIADRCMMWRWQPLMADAAYVAAVVKHEKASGLSHAQAAKYVKDNRREFGLPASPTHGYCGLAGRPEA